MRKKLDQASSSSQSVTVESDTVEIVTKRKVIQFSADEDLLSIEHHLDCRPQGGSGNSCGYM